MICKECDGTGYVWQFTGSARNLPTESGNGRMVECPECGGTGEVEDWDEEVRSEAAGPVALREEARFEGSWL